MIVNGLKYSFEYTTKQSFAVEADELLRNNESFKIESDYDNFTIFIPSQMAAYYSNNKAFINFGSLDALRVAIGFALVNCNKIISSTLALENEIKLLR